jgi:hypothetical protein
MLVGTYNWNNQLELVIATEPDSKGTVSGTFNNLNYNWSCPLSGFFQPWDTLHNRILLSLSGKFQHKPDPSSQPAVRYEVISVFGYGETTDSSSPIQTLTLIQGWANDGSQNQNTVDAQPAYGFIRQ